MVMPETSSIKEKKSEKFLCKYYLCILYNHSDIESHYKYFKKGSHSPFLLNPLTLRLKVSTHLS